MYKRLYLNREVPKDRPTYSLATSDIEGTVESPGAQPRLWNHPEKPFFTKNDPATHLREQHDQYKNALAEQLLFTQKFASVYQETETRSGGTPRSATTPTRERSKASSSDSSYSTRN